MGLCRQAQFEGEDDSESRPPPFDVARLRAETQDAFGLPRTILLGFCTASASLGFLFVIPKLIGTLAGAPKAAPLSESFQDLAINGAVALAAGFLLKLNVDQETRLVEISREGSLIGSLTVLLSDAAGKLSATRLAELRNRRSTAAWRPVLCIGDLEYCKECIRTSNLIGEELLRSEYLLVPVINGQPSAEEIEILSRAAQGNLHVATPSFTSDWLKLVTMQSATVKKEGLREDLGQVMIIKKNGKVAMRFTGLPDWMSLVSEVAWRQQVGADTTNI